MIKSSNRFYATILGAIIILSIAVIVFLQFSKGQDGGLAKDTIIDYTIQPSLGSDEAPVKVTLFEDFSCVHCATFTEETFPKLKDDFLGNGQAEFFFVNNQFLGANSLMAGVAAECAYEQDETLFWDFKTVLMRAQNKISYSPKGLSDLVANVPGLDPIAMNTCLEERHHIETINEDLAMARSLGVTSTPTVFVNGEMVKTGDRSNPSYEAIKTAITKALEVASASSEETR